MNSAYYEQPDPNFGGLPSRAAFRSDAPAIDLNGVWRFHLSPTVAEAPLGFWRPNFDDSSWADLPVPSNWQMPGHGRPAYTNEALLFPVDPPLVSTENPTGDHRLTFDVPADWAGVRAVLRFEGIDSCGRVWLNGRELGVTSGSRLPTEFDATAALRPGRPNVLAVRVHQWSSGSYLEDQDMWWLSGIFRDVTLLARPAAGVDDFFVHADYDHLTGHGTLRVDTDSPALLTVPALGLADASWREAGLHRMRHRVMEVRDEDDALVVTTRVAAAWQPIGLLATYCWTASPDGALGLALSVTADGTFPFPLPRIGLRLAVPEELSTVEWFGLGPGEAYADSRQAARLGRFTRSVDQLQNPYVFPQENGNRMDVRWVELRDPAGGGLRVTGHRCIFDMTARRWTSEALDAAQHTTDLVPDDVIHLNLDIGHTGLGSSSCGPAVAARYRLGAGPHSLRLIFQQLT